ncbi:YSC84-related protein [Roseovarius tolerans]|nr:lipid-binding SYLF domain-containing protein [Roseovarius tolerans]
MATSALMNLSACGVGGFGVTDLRKDIFRAGLSVDATATLARLTASEPESANITQKAQALLIFPHIIKGGYGIGLATGNGVWREDGKKQSYYRSTAASYGFQGGVTSFGYVMAFMDQASIDYVQNSNGWEVGVGPSVMVADFGFMNKLSTTTVRKGIVVFFVDRVGFFAGSGIEGTKINPL